MATRLFSRHSSLKTTQEWIVWALKPRLFLRLITIGLLHSQGLKIVRPWFQQVKRVILAINQVVKTNKRKKANEIKNQNRCRQGQHPTSLGQIWVPQSRQRYSNGRINKKSETLSVAIKMTPCRREIDQQLFQKSIALKIRTQLLQLWAFVMTAARDTFLKGGLSNLFLANKGWRVRELKGDQSPTLETLRAQIKTCQRPSMSKAITMQGNKSQPVVKGNKSNFHPIKTKLRKTS